MPDAHFEVPRLAAVYDVLDPDRSDLEVYCELVDELGATSVLDVGCGTGSFACMLADRGVRVVALDPAGASLDVARAKPGAGRVTWVHGDVRALPSLSVDLVTMTGNVAQVFVADDEWTATLRACRAALRPGGHLVFESRRPEDEAWRRWTREGTWKRTDLPGGERVEHWVEVTDVQPGVVSFRSTFVFEPGGETYTSESTLRFRTDAELSSSLREAGFEVEGLREAPDRPAREYVFIASRPG